jgi:predicted PurR-regulated permease PerM
MTEPQRDITRTFLAVLFVGVVGGLIAFGLIGIFVGPVVLAAAHKLLSAWVDEEIGEFEPPGQQALSQEE